MPLKTLQKIVMNPLAGLMVALGIVSKVLSLGFVDAVAAATWSSIGSIFTGLSIASFTLGPKVEFLPEGTLTLLALAAGTVYLTKIGVNYFDAIDDRLDRRGGGRR